MIIVNRPSNNGKSYLVRFFLLHLMCRLRGEELLRLFTARCIQTHWYNALEGSEASDCDETRRESFVESKSKCALFCCGLSNMLC